MEKLLKQTLGIDINSLPKAGKTITNEEKSHILNSIKDILDLMSEKKANDWKNTWEMTCPLFYSMESDGNNRVEINYYIDKVGEYPKCDFTKCSINFFNNNKLQDFDIEYHIVKEAFIRYAEYFTESYYLYENVDDYIDEHIDNTDVINLFKYLCSTNGDDIEGMCLTFFDAISSGFIVEEGDFYTALSSILSGEGSEEYFE